MIVKQYFQTMVDEVTSEGDTNTMKDLEEFDNDVRQMLEVSLYKTHKVLHVNLCPTRSVVQVVNKMICNQKLWVFCIFVTE